MNKVLRLSSDDEKKTDDDFIIEIRNEKSQSKKELILNKLLYSVRPTLKKTWDLKIRQYVRWRMKLSKSGFGIYDEDDLHQRCILSFAKAALSQFDMGKGVKFSTYVYSAIEKTVNRVSCELRKKKRTLSMPNSKNEENNLKKIRQELDPDPDIETESTEILNVEENDEIRLSPRYMTVSIHDSYGDNAKMTIGDIIPDNDEDEMSENQSLIVEAVFEKCKNKMSDIQRDIFLNGEVYRTRSVRDLAKKYDKSEPTISAIKKRKIFPILKEIKSEIIEEFNCRKF